jgi:hypothetical protein
MLLRFRTDKDKVNSLPVLQIATNTHSANMKTYSVLIGGPTTDGVISRKSSGPDRLAVPTDMSDPYEYGKTWRMCLDSLTK